VNVGSGDLCSEQQLWSNFAKKKGRTKRAGPPVHDDLVRRDFKRHTSQRAVVDRHHRTPNDGRQTLRVLREGRLLTAHRGLLHRRSHEGVVGGARTPPRHPPATPLRNRRARRSRIAISFQCYVRTLKNNGLVGSMGRVGAAGDNAAMESFFALLQKNVLNNQRWETREELRLAIVTWIERTYHRRRRQRALGKMTPIEFEALDEALQAA